jgi:hypothetical protein
MPPRPVLILLLGLILGISAYLLGYHLPTAPHRAMLRSDQPELAWLKREFALDGGDFDRIRKLHDGYRPYCEAMCLRIATQQHHLQSLLASSTSITPEIHACLDEIARLRLECHRAMLGHFLEVSRAMPAAQGQRYLHWVLHQTVLAPEPMAQLHTPSGHHAH